MSGGQAMRPAANAVIPGYTPVIALMLLGTLLSVLDFDPLGWVIAGAALSVVAAWYTRYPLRWLLILFLAAGQLAHPTNLDVRFLVLLAGLHLLYVLSTLAPAPPWSSWVQPAAFLPALRRYVTIQLPCQLVAVVALLLLAPAHGGHRPLTVAAFAVIGAGASAGLGVLLFRTFADH